jgi:uncharacterized protein
VRLPCVAGWRKLARVTDEDVAEGIDYRALLQDALIGVVRSALRRAAAEGLPGEHHFYLTFRTDAPGVEIAHRLARQHPQEMTIILQHQYWNLEVQDDAFGVTLKFGGAPQRLVVPFAALTSFVDPSVPFGLRLQALAEPAAAETEVPTAQAPAVAAEGPVTAPPRAPGTVVNLEAFRRRE